MNETLVRTRSIDQDDLTRIIYKEYGITDPENTHLDIRVIGSGDSAMENKLNISLVEHLTPNLHGFDEPEILKRDNRGEPLV